jgi:hypothetical protein
MNKTLFLSPNPDQDPTDQPQPEARMREALGLRTDGTRVAPTPGHRPDRLLDHGAGSPRRHRFVQEGEVPVEVMTLREHGGRNGAPSRFRVDETALAAERLAREQAERAFAEATDRLRELQTKLGHAELARDEALALAGARQSQIEALRAEAVRTQELHVQELRVQEVRAQELRAQEMKAHELKAQEAPAQAWEVTGRDDVASAAPVPRKAATPRVAKAPKPVTPKLAAPKPRGRQKAPKPVKWWIKKAPAAE